MRSPGLLLLEMTRRAGSLAWRHLPPSAVERPAVRAVGRFAFRHIARHQLRRQCHSTWFMRNPPLLETLCAIVGRAPAGSPVRLASVACSTGAELYSIVYLLRSSHPALELRAVGIDVCAGVVDAAREGVYRRSRTASEGGAFDTGCSELEPALTGSGEWLHEIFVEDHGAFRVRDWVRDGVSWVVADAADPGLADRFGPQDVVLANNFLGPMDEVQAERCLRNVARLARPGGIFVVDGVDLDLKSRVLESLGATPVTDRLREIYEADPTKRGWPWTRWSHEPLDRTRPDWAMRYGAVFVMDASGVASPRPRPDSGERPQG